MSSIAIGLIAVIVGAVFCFWGVVAMRVVIAVWGAFAGFNLGAGLVAGIGHDAYLSTPLGWIVGIAVAILFAVLAYLFYAVAILLAMVSIGFALGTALMAAFGVDWSWVIIGVGVICGALLAWATLAVNLPAVLLVVLSALGGSTAIVAGMMFLSDTIRTTDVAGDQVTATVAEHWWWWVLYAGFAIIGVVAQVRLLGQNRDLQAQW
ncbi:DUF4203 domain-containing protein [Gordonia caeni]|uniref:TM7S3/TM198-like domain-containing protein n=1 Tax=Gordonia caeni TaxID=1007097 RepID=A0ABP7PQV4_9ACTN